MKDAIAKLIWEVESFHGLVLTVKLKQENEAINCCFENFEWLKKFNESQPFSFERLPPMYPYKSRIQTWKQGSENTPRITYTDPKKAFESFGKLLIENGYSWNDVDVIWSHPDNQPDLIIDNFKNKSSKTDYLPVKQISLQPKNGVAP